MSKHLLQDLEPSEAVPEDQIIQVLLDAIFEATVQIHEAAGCIQTSSAQAFKAMAQLDELLEKNSLRHREVEESMRALAVFLCQAEQAAGCLNEPTTLEVDEARPAINGSATEYGSLFLGAHNSKRLQCSRNMSYEERHALIHGIADDDFTQNGLRNRGLMRQWMANLGL